jgi:large subunit ribosomal protein L22
MEAIAKLRNCPNSPRKMRLIADIIRGKSVEEALNIVKFHPMKTYAQRIEKLILSAVSNWQIKNDDTKVEQSNLFVKTVYVDNAKQLKRVRPAPQGRANRIRKRSNHVTLIVDNREKKEVLTDNKITE